MRPQSRHDNRPSITVVTGIINMLNSRSDIHSTPDMSRVIRFDDIFPPIINPPNAQKKAIAAIGDIYLMIFLEPILHEGNARQILFAMPERALRAYALIE